MEVPEYAVRISQPPVSMRRSTRAWERLNIVPTTTTSDGTRNTWLTNNSVGVKVSPDWRFVGKFNGSWSEASAGAFADGNYVEGVTGFAYRPAKDDRLNALFKYTYFFDEPSAAPRNRHACSS